MDLSDLKQAAMCAGMLVDRMTTEIQLGGTSYLHGTFEIRKYTLDGYGFALFNDWGMVWNTFEEMNPLQMVLMPGPVSYVQEPNLCDSPGWSLPL